jgi:hypothetical protein
MSMDKSIEHGKEHRKKRRRKHLKTCIKENKGAMKLLSKYKRKKQILKAEANHDPT